jgi:hypothetical protein
MFSLLADTLDNFFTAAENRHREDFLASSTDLADLERRTRDYDTNHNPFAWPISSGPSDWQA